MRYTYSNLTLSLSASHCPSLSVGLSESPGLMPCFCRWFCFPLKNWQKQVFIDEYSANLQSPHYERMFRVYFVNSIFDWHRRGSFNVWADKQIKPAKQRQHHFFFSPIRSRKWDVQCREHGHRGYGRYMDAKMNKKQRQNESARQRGADKENSEINKTLKKMRRRENEHGNEWGHWKTKNKKCTKKKTIANAISCS